MDSEEEIADDGAKDREVETVQQSVGELYIITAYCDCYDCCRKKPGDKGYGITASGEKAVQGITVAMDKTIPFGTKVYIDGVGERIVQDRGGAIIGNRIDIYFSDHQSALNFGRQTKQVTIMKGE